MTIRWLGAFRGVNQTLLESLEFELNRIDEVACEPLQNGKSMICQSKVGLLVSPTAIVKRFNGDCYSEYNNEGFLYKKRNPKHTSSSHKEVWAKPVYTGIVVKGRTEGEGFLNLSKEARETILEVSKKYSLPIFELKNGKLYKI